MEHITTESLRNDVLKLAQKQYGTAPDYLWMKDPKSAVLRHTDSKKWYAVLMEIPKKRLGLPGEGSVDILNLKADPIMSGSLLLQQGILPGYNMHKGSWITVLLDGTVEWDLIVSLLDMSFETTAKKVRAKPMGVRSSNWIVPANPKFYDIEKAVRESPDGIFTWKQSNHIAVGDTVYLYVASPVSAIRYQCRAVEVDIPCQYADENVRMSRVMRLQLLRRYDKEPVSFELLKAHGVTAVRGPRNIPQSLIHEIETMYPPM